MDAGIGGSTAVAVTVILGHAAEGGNHDAISGVAAGHAEVDDRCPAYTHAVAGVVAHQQMIDSAFTDAAEIDPRAGALPHGPIMNRHDPESGSRGADAIGAARDRKAV